MQIKTLQIEEDVKEMIKHCETGEELNRLFKHDELEKELAHWKANHANIALRCILLRDRIDLPVERIRAFEQMEALQNENLALKEANEELSLQIKNLSITR